MNFFSKDADHTYLALGGLVVAALVVVGLMLLHHMDDGRDLLSAEHIMAIISLPTVILSYAVGKNQGENGNGR